MEKKGQLFLKEKFQLMNSEGMKEIILKVTKAEESLENCHTLKETKETWQLKAEWDSEWDTGHTQKTEKWLKSEHSL